MSHSLNNELNAEVMEGSGLSSMQHSMPTVAKGPISNGDLWWYVPMPGQLGNIASSGDFSVSHSLAPIANQKESSFRRIMVRSF